MRKNENTDTVGKLPSVYDVSHKIEDELNSLYERRMVDISNKSIRKEMDLNKETEGIFNTKITNKIFIE